jgi:L-alanine-DL-glutamate epimerase-like enolase superfamily enzyme
MSADSIALSRRSPVDVAVIDVVGPAIIGKDSADIDGRLADIAAATRALDQDGVIGRASSLTEIALWDLRAQREGRPLWACLGGERRELPVLIVEGYALPDERDEEFAERIAQRVEEGYRAVKIEAASYGDPSVLARRLGEIRRLAGLDFEIVIDIAWGWQDAEEGVKAARLWEEWQIAWIEDPFNRTRVAEMAELRSKLGIPVAAGDEATRPEDLARLVNGEAIDVLRLDATAIGGIGATGRLARLAHERGLRASMHVHPEVNEHCAIAWPSFDHVESFPLDRPFDACHALLESPFMLRVADGRSRPPATPGTGIRADLQAVRRTAYRSSEIGA